MLFFLHNECLNLAFVFVHFDDIRLQKRARRQSLALFLYVGFLEITGEVIEDLIVIDVALEQLYKFHFVGHVGHTVELFQTVPASALISGKVRDSSGLS